MTTGRINQVARDEWEMRNTHAHPKKGASAESHTNQTPGIRHETERHTAANAAVTRTAERNSPEVQSKQERSPYQERRTKLWAETPERTLRFNT